MAIAVFYWLFSFMQGQNLFVKGKVLYAKYSDVDGLLPTKPVNINGLKVGRVQDIFIVEKKDSMYFVVEMIIDKDVNFSKNTVAEIYEPGLLAGKMVKLNLDYSGELAKSGDTLSSASKQSLMNMLSDKLGPTKNQVDSVLFNLNNTLEGVGNITDSQTNRSLKQILDDLDKTIVALEKTANSVTIAASQANKFLSSTGDNFSILSKETESLVKSTKSTIDKYGEVADKINQADLDKTFKNLEEASLSLSSIMNKIESSDGSLNKIISNPDLYNNLEKTTSSLNELLTDFKENPDRYIQFSVFGKKTKSSN